MLSLLALLLGSSVLAERRAAHLLEAEDRVRLLLAVIALARAALVAATTASTATCRASSAARRPACGGLRAHVARRDRLVAEVQEAQLRREAKHAAVPLLLQLLLLLSLACALLAAALQQLRCALKGPAHDERSWRAPAAANGGAPRTSLHARRREPDRGPWVRCAALAGMHVLLAIGERPAARAGLLTPVTPLLGMPVAIIVITGLRSSLTSMHRRSASRPGAPESATPLCAAALSEQCPQA